MIVSCRLLFYLSGILFYRFILLSVLFAFINDYTVLLVLKEDAELLLLLLNNELLNNHPADVELLNVVSKNHHNSDFYLQYQSPREIGLWGP